MRADEAKLKQARRPDVMERILAMIAEEKAKMAEEERRKRGQEEGSVSNGSE